MIPRATYRLQLHKAFPFAAAEQLVPYLDGLGISHIYTSPITRAASGSMHGYDVVDPTTISPELGGEDAFRSLVSTLRSRGMGIIIDIVPNHMGVGSDENRWWNDVLSNGPSSRFARYFDIDWSEKLLLPILDAPLPDVLARSEITMDLRNGEPSLILYGARRVPLRSDEDFADGDANGDALREIIARQHYRLDWWRTANDELNWRRFFTINELAGLRAEDPEVFEATHQLFLRLYAEGLIDGVRIDHVDGLADPAGYCRTLRQRFDAISRPADAPQGPAYIVVEKILGRNETLAVDWGIDGTTGYDFMEQASALLHDPQGEAPLTTLLHAFTGRTLDFDEEELRARQELLRWSFEAQLQGCVRAFLALARTSRETEGLTSGMLRRAIERMLWVFPVYRTYGDGNASPEADAAVRRHVREQAARFTPPGEASIVDHILAWLAGDGPGDAKLAAEAVRRFQQLSAPIAAKSVEDTAFYRYGRLLSRTDVGFDATRFSMPVATFHDSCRQRARDHPHSMLATATHDHKRGEDVRARLAVLSEVPERWRASVERWDRQAGELTKNIDPGDRYMLYQMLFGTWPFDLQIEDSAALTAFTDRIIGWQTKALREAKLRSSWEAPEVGYEAACAGLVRSLLDSQLSSKLLTDIRAFVDWLRAPTMANMLAQVMLRCTIPGVPDCYQGCEFADFSIVDPDNRRPVNYAPRLECLSGTNNQIEPDAMKFSLLQQLLMQRREQPELFANGTYQPITVQGRRAEHVLAFARTYQDQRLTCVAAIRCADALAGSTKTTPDPEWWEDTTLEDGRSVASILSDLPVWVG